MTEPVCTTCGAPEHADCFTYSNGNVYILGHPKFFGRIIGKCQVCNSLIGSAIGRCDSFHCRAAKLPWWLLDAEGWPIVRVTNRPAWLFWLRVLFQNIRKVTG